MGSLSRKQMKMGKLIFLTLMEVKYLAEQVYKAWYSEDRSADL